MASARKSFLRFLGTTTLLAVGPTVVLPGGLMPKSACHARCILRRAVGPDGERREVYMLDEEQMCELDELGELVNCRPDSGNEDSESSVSDELGELANHRPDSEQDSKSSVLGSNGCLSIVRRRNWPRFRDLLDEFGEVNPYKVLGVTSWASQDEIRRAYMKVCKKEHPDLNRGVESMEWLLVSKAYQTLSQGRLTYTVRSTARHVGAVAGGFMEVMFAAVAAGASAVNAARSRRNETT
eukprot:TRINITY_DN95265_c0_g1_i1.p1 TRINITY_DN95265_c0_g1~~TRINITY_DN95265_c0_g1_i1.p1  ORF type:complete len:239 (+),score=30.45 TRINITY_DN95265_c0_g1_i1:28-744(+)